MNHKEEEKAVAEASPSTLPPTDANNAPESTSTSSKRKLSDDGSTLAAADSDVQAPALSESTKKRKGELLDKLKEDIKKDATLPLASSMLVFGRGDPSAEIVFIGTMVFSMVMVV